MSLVSARRQLLMLIAGYAQEVSSRRKDRRCRLRRVQCLLQTVQCLESMLLCFIDI